MKKCDFDLRLAADEIAVLSSTSDVCGASWDINGRILGEGLHRFEFLPTMPSSFER